MQTTCEPVSGSEQNGTKENPPAATDGLPKDFRKASTDRTRHGFDIAFAKIMQSRDVVRMVIAHRDDLAPDWIECLDYLDISDLSAVVASGFEIYKNCFPTAVRNNFKQIFSYDFERFESCLIQLSEFIDEPILWPGAAQ